MGYPYVIRVSSMQYEELTNANFWVMIFVKSAKIGHENLNLFLLRSWHPNIPRNLFLKILGISLNSLLKNFKSLELQVTGYETL